MRTFIVSTWLCTLFVSTAAAQREDRPDALFPDPGRPSLVLGTGAPYVGLAEVGVGIHRSFAVGLITGIAPRDRAIGVRPRFAIPLGERTRVVVATPFFYYPRTSRRESETWLLLRTSVVVEGRFASGARLHAGVSMLYADCTDMFFRRGNMNTDGFRGGVWNTFEIGGTVPLTVRAELFYEIGTVHRGFTLMRFGDWAGTTPVVLAVGVAVAFDAVERAGSQQTGTR